MRIFIAGHGGMVGSAILRHLKASHHGANLITRTRARLDLTCQSDVRSFFRDNRIDQVYLAAAKVGGISANDSLPADFIRENLLIQTNVIAESHRSGVKRLLLLGSSCIYPRLAPQPITEDQLLEGALEPTNEPYAIAKIAGIKMCESYRRQHGVDYRSVMPTNLYGPHDNFSDATSHVIPALIQRFHRAKANGSRSVTVWGTGQQRREFLHVDDLAAACVLVMNVDTSLYEQCTRPMQSQINIGTGEDVTIGELARLIAGVVGFSGEIHFDPTKPDGAPRKLLDVSRIHRLGWQHSIDLRQGLRSTYEWFLENQGCIRT